MVLRVGICFKFITVDTMFLKERYHILYCILSWGKTLNFCNSIGRSTVNLQLSSSRDNVLKVDIFFEELNYEVISEEPSYEASGIFVLGL